MSKNLLIELFVEELPPKALKRLGEAFAKTLFEGLQAQGLTAAGSAAKPFASPRRLAVRVTDVAEKAADKPITQKLMPVAVGLDANGGPTPALLKKLSALGADASVVPQLKRESDGKAEVLFLKGVAAGATLQEGLQKALDEALAKLPIPKVMTYQLQDGWSTVNFVRPAHGLIALHGSDVVPVTVLGLEASNLAHGHRFEAKVAPIVIRDADSYHTQLENEGAVIADYDERSRKMIRLLRAEAKKLNTRLEVEVSGLSDEETESALLDNPLVQEVTSLVEWPNVLVCEFEQEFLEVPQECLILTMKANQKYFPLLDSNGKLSNKFLIVSNIRPADPSQVVSGNERVVRPRLADAKFFFDQDRKKSLESRVTGLAKVVYHNKLGSQGERVERVRHIARDVAAQLGAEYVDLADRAALLAKADLLTDMVGEFPELQGTMGRYYAENDGEDALVAEAIEQHYWPRFSGDALPRTEVSLSVAIADKLETLMGMFSIGQVPTGDKDPFALRRHALGVIRMLVESKLPLDVDALIDAAAQPFEGVSVEHRAALVTFIYDRLANTLREQGYSAQEVDAVLALQPQRLADVAQRLAAVRAFAALPEAEALAAANKRVGNILKKVEGEVPPQVNTLLLSESEETALNQALVAVKPQADAAFERGDYTSSLQSLAALKSPVDNFFDNVMVNADDPVLRANRLALLGQLQMAMNRVADLSRLAG